MNNYAAYAQQGVAAADAPAHVRAEFIQKTYIHLGLAILAFAGLTAAILSTPLAAQMTMAMTSGMSWIVVLVAFMAVGWIAERWAMSATSVSMQYLGLGLYVVAEAIIFVPLLYMATLVGPSVIPTAGMLTAVVFGGLTAVAFVTKKDFSFLGRALMIGGFAAIGFIAASLLFGFSLGLLFSTAMVVLAAGYILYYTSQILHHYPVGSHVAAALALFAAVALLFWYIIRIVMAFTRD